jgi:hypothetical protein
MSLTKNDQELLDALYPEGYVVSDKEVKSYHLLFVKIFPTKGRENKLNAMVQQMSVRDFQVLKAQLDKGWALPAITGYNEFAIIHDPTKVKDKPVEMVSTPVEELESTPVPEVKTKSTRSKTGPKPKS